MLELEPHILPLIGAAVAASGVALILWAIRALHASRTGGRSDSFLAPTLVVDTLDPDLRIAYMRTLVIDARGAARTGAPYEIGRQLRRAITAVQALRFADGDENIEQQLLALLPEICIMVEEEHPTPELQYSWERDVTQLRDRMLAEVQDPQRRLLRED